VSPLGSVRKGSDIYVLQAAQLGSELGFPEDPEGAWVDIDVFFDRGEAERFAQLYETAPIQDAEGRDITREVVTMARVVTMDEVGAEFGEDRQRLIVTMFRDRMNALSAAERENTPHEEGSEE
jgi:hypothetical protein